MLKQLVSRNRILAVALIAFGFTCFGISQPKKLWKMDTSTGYPVTCVYHSDSSIVHAAIIKYCDHMGFKIHQSYFDKNTMMVNAYSTHDDAFGPVQAHIQFFVDVISKEEVRLGLRISSQTDLANNQTGTWWHYAESGVYFRAFTGIQMCGDSTLSTPQN